ncbi:hypothetical protein FACS1894161_2820 [Spirochaetia bacterium]|nr:hypothetical protein FACS1894161_2820 [Spirochaetia bacterium]
MQKVDGYPKHLSEILNQRYIIPYYQREYRWEQKQIEEMVFDLLNEFKIHYRPGGNLLDVKNYGIYFLGPIIVTQDNEIIDGQQRLTSLSLLLIKLNHLQKAANVKRINIDSLIFSEDYGKKTFVIDESERDDCLNNLYENDGYKKDNKIDTVENICSRYDDITEALEGEIEDGFFPDALPFFIEWLRNRVFIIRIETETQGDAHKVFENMNDRGLRLSSVEMIKGHLLAQISDSRRNEANIKWKEVMQKLNSADNQNDIDFVQTWFRAKYAQTMRERKAGAENRDFELIGNAPNKWLIENKQAIGLKFERDYERFIFEELPFYADIYSRLHQYSTNYDKHFQYVYYNAHRDFNLQIQAIMSAVDINDSPADIDKKINIVSCFFDLYIMLRIVNYTSVTYSSTLYRAFIITKDIRNKPAPDILQYTKKYLEQQIIPETNFSGIPRFHLNQFSKRYIFHMLARFTDYLNEKCGTGEKFDEIVNRKRKNSYDIEHIWADDYSQGNHLQEFQTEHEFKEYRNYLGNLLLLPRDKNRSYQDMPYEEKIKHYNSENLLVRSLNSLCYKNNPSFMRFLSDSGLPFKAYDHYNKEDLDERQGLYKLLAENIWNLDRLDEVAQ